MKSLFYFCVLSVVERLLAQLPALLSVAGCNDSVPLRTTNSCPVGGKVTITVEGTGFSVTGASVRIGDSDCPGVIARPPNKLLCTLPPGKLGQIADVRVHVPAGIQQCADGWTRWENGCYLMSPSRADWNSAEQICARQHAAHLSSALTAAETAFLHELANKQAIHIGLHDQVSPTKFIWTDGQVLQWTGWAPGEPNNNGGNEHCAAIAESGSWNDIPCMEQYNYLCKLQLSAAPALDLVLEGGVQYRQPFVLPTSAGFEDLGIGGLDKQIEEIIRRAFISRTQDPELLGKLGVRHVKGVMLHGPPGTGKTLLARKIGELLQAKRIQVVNGPEVMNKFVGQSEQNIRQLFADPLKEWEQLGNDAGLHVIIFDEIDAIMRNRGSSSDDSAARAVYDGVTNTLLSLMDGMHSAGNVLVIGLTNRIELIDIALMRPGRFEVSIRMPLPDISGRASILRIHTRNLAQHGYLDPSVNLTNVAEQAHSYTGADLEGVVKSAVSFALARTTADDSRSLMVSIADFQAALNEVPATVGNRQALSMYFRRGILPTAPGATLALERSRRVVSIMRSGNKPQLFRLLLHGPPGVGTTALAAHLAYEAKWPFAHILNVDSFLGLHEAERISRMTAIFDDAAKVSHGIVVVDKLEALIDYSPVGPRLALATLTALTNLLQRTPLDSNCLLVIVTTSLPDVWKVLQIDHLWDMTVSVPLLDRIDCVKSLLALQVVHNRAEAEEAASALPPQLAVKRLLVVADLAMALSKHGGIAEANDFLQASGMLGLFNESLTTRFTMTGSII